MKRVSKGEKWTLMCPDQCPGLSDVYGDEFDTLYKKYESEGKGETVNARDIWFKVLDSQIETGTPYMLYKDACNKKSNQKNLGTIKSSNLCVSPETLILTDKGHIEIQTLKNKKVNIWNGKEFSETTIKQTSDNSELITIAFSDGSELTCTKYHKFYIQMKYPTSKMKQDIIKSKKVSIIEAQNLKPNMKLIKCEYPIIDNKKELKSAYTNGIFSADGTYTNISEKEERKCNFKSLEGKSFCKRHIDYQRNDEVNEYCCGISYTKKPHITLYGEKIKLLEYLDYRSIGEKKDNKLNVTLPVDLKDKFFVPMNYSLKSKLDWVAGYCDGDGSIARNGTNQSLQIACIHKEFLLKIKLMLQTCGIASKVTLNMNERLSKLPDGKGGLAYYKSKKLWRLLVGSNDLQKLVELGFTPKRLIINKHEPQRNATQFIKVSKITDNNRTDKTFCFNEPLRHAGIFNGVISSQCTEIIEYSDDKETAVCNLASLGLPKFVEFPNPNFEEVIFYSKPNCDYCKLAKNHLLKFGIYFTHIVLDCDETRHEIYNKLTKDYKLESPVNSVPQILIDGEYIGGYLELIKKVKPEFNYEKLHSMTKIVTENLNKVIDINFYPTEKTKRSNFLHRPIGIGVQGLADTFALMNIPFYSDDAKEVNKNIFETIYHAALEQSNETSMERMKDMKVLKNIIEKIGYPSVSEPNPDPHALINTDKFYSWNSEEEGENLKHTLDTLINLRKPIYNEVKNLEGDVLGSYSSFIGSPTSKGILQFDMWDVTPSKRYDWDKLKESVKQYGIRNSLLLAPMPTASTSQILGNNECFEPFTSNIYVRRTIAGEFIVANKHLMEELINIGKWDENIKDSIIANQGSIQHLKLPQHIKNKYKIVWEIPMKHILNMAKDRGAFIDQSQSTNLWMKEPTYEKLTAMHFYAWKLGLKTGLYYLRTKAKATAQQFTIDPNLKNKIQMEQDIHEPCEMCSG
jgi:ribonucleotide reductase alpha subunit